MEALVAVSAAALTVYDMCKALDKSIEITDIYLVEKTGGKSGDYRRRIADEPNESRRQERAVFWSWTIIRWSAT